MNKQRQLRCLFAQEPFEVTRRESRIKIMQAIIIHPIWRRQEISINNNHREQQEESDSNED